MRLDPRSFGMAAGVTAAVLFLICAFAVTVAPEPTTAFFGTLIHADLSGISRSLTVSSFLVGLVSWTFGTGLTFGFAAAIYNWLTRAPAVMPATEHPATGRA